MRIILDIMSGDKAPLEILKGAVDATTQDYAKTLSLNICR